MLWPHIQALGYSVIRCKVARKSRLGIRREVNVVLQRIRRLNVLAHFHVGGGLRIALQSASNLLCYTDERQLSWLSYDFQNEQQRSV